MSKNERYVDKSIHHVTGMVVTGGTFEGDNTVIVNSNPSDSYDWKQLRTELQNALKTMDAQKRGMFAKSFQKLEDAIDERDSSGLKKCAKSLGEVGIEILKDCAAGTLSAILLKLAGIA